MRRWWLKDIEFVLKLRPWHTMLLSKESLRSCTQTANLRLLYDSRMVMHYRPLTSNQVCSICRTWEVSYYLPAGQDIQIVHMQRTMLDTRFSSDSSEISVQGTLKFKQGFNDHDHLIIEHPFSWTCTLDEHPPFRLLFLSIASKRSIWKTSILVVLHREHQEELLSTLHCEFCSRWTLELHPPIH